MHKPPQLPLQYPVPLLLSYASRLMETAHMDVLGVLNLRKRTTDLQPTQTVSVLS